MIRIRYLPAALRSLDEIYAYTLDSWGEAQADDYVGGIFAMCEDITAHPHRRTPKEYGVTGFVSIYRRHRIYWRQPSSEEVVVVCILHERMHQPDRLANADDEG